MLAGLAQRAFSAVTSAVSVSPTKPTASVTGTSAEPEAEAEMAQQQEEPVPATTAAKEKDAQDNQMEEEGPDPESETPVEKKDDAQLETQTAAAADAHIETVATEAERLADAEEEAKLADADAEEAEAKMVDDSGETGAANLDEAEDPASADPEPEPAARFSVARTRTTRAGRADPDPLLDPDSASAENRVQAEEEDDPARGKDGKSYLLAGLYYSASTAAYSASLSSSSSGGRSRAKRSSTTTTTNGTDWRSITPSKSSAFPPPIFYGETLLEPPERDDDDDGDDPAEARRKGASRPFRLPFDILRDHWHIPSSSASSSAGRKGKGKGRARGALHEDANGTGDEKGGRGGGKGGDKTTEEDVLRREQSRKPPAYRYLGKNVYMGRGPDKAAIPAICMCRPPARKNEMGCGSGCINRMMQYCCEPKLCPCGPEQCGNPPLSKREGVPVAKDGLVVIWVRAAVALLFRRSFLPSLEERKLIIYEVASRGQTGNRGFGLKTMRAIKKGEFVLEYRGEIISRNESYRRVLTDYKDSHSYYFMDYDGFEVVDAGQRGNCARFINHSCGPNLEVVRWRLAQYEEYQMGLFALRDIPIGTELTYDYGWQDFSALAPKTASASTSSSSASTADATIAATPTTDASSSTAVDSFSPAEAIVLGNGTAIDPARQRCYCGAAECSGFLGGRKKTTSRGGNNNNKSEPNASAKRKGKRKAMEDATTGGETPAAQAEEAPKPPPAPRLAFAQAKIRVVDPAQRSAPTPPPQLDASPARPAKKPRTSQASQDRARNLEQERNRVVGAMRSGREAAKKAAGKLVGSLGGRLSRDGGRGGE
ncbi:hypothetical protein JCM10908_001415 [Rhodotorula pacifica]|uniref:uncharacterized protein n=1 Tax=Rhodotorula pacifica TaxID=1495444 RepID=UPI00317D85D2